MDFSKASSVNQIKPPLTLSSSTSPCNLFEKQLFYAGLSEENKGAIQDLVISDIQEKSTPYIRSKLKIFPEGSDAFFQMLTSAMKEVFVTGTPLEKGRTFFRLMHGIHDLKESADNHDGLFNISKEEARRRKNIIKDLQDFVHLLNYEKYFVGLDLSQSDYSYLDLSYLNLSKTIWSSAVLDRTNFTGCDLIGAEMEYTCCSHALFCDANLSKTNWRFAILSYGDLTNTTAINSDFDYANLTETNFTNAELKNVRFTHATMVKTNMTGADVDNIDLNGAFINGVIVTRVRNHAKSQPLCPKDDHDNCVIS